MGFSDRTEKSSKLIELLTTNYWKKLAAHPNKQIFHEPYGYETHISPGAQKALKAIYTTTGKHIRFTPDYIVGQNGSNAADPAILMEYKVTTTPRYKLEEAQWNSGQIEADAWDNYMNLVAAGVCVAIVIYCPYHPRPLLCDFPETAWVTHARRKVQQTGTGSGTDYVNVNLLKLRTFTEFMASHFSVPDTTSKPLVKTVLDAAKLDPLLQTTHAAKSNYAGNKTGFNWEPYSP